MKMVERLWRLSVARVLTITTDNGKEMARHRQISEAVGTPVYFACLHHVWE